MAEIRINGLKDSTQTKFFPDIPEWKTENGEIEENIIAERIGEFYFLYVF